MKTILVISLIICFGCSKEIVPYKKYGLGSKSIEGIGNLKSLKPITFKWSYEGEYSDHDFYLYDTANNKRRFGTDNLPTDSLGNMITISE